MLSPARADGRLRLSSTAIFSSASGRLCRKRSAIKEVLQQLGIIIERRVRGLGLGDRHEHPHTSDVRADEVRARKAAERDGVDVGVTARRRHEHLRHVEGGHAEERGGERDAKSARQRRAWRGKVAEVAEAVGEVRDLRVAPVWPSDSLGGRTPARAHAEG